jgi:hypothetical protein
LRSFTVVLMLLEGGASVCVRTLGSRSEK